MGHIVNALLGRGLRRFLGVALCLIFIPPFLISCGTAQSPEVNDFINGRARAVVVVRSDSVLSYYESGSLVREFEVIVGSLEDPTPLAEWRIWVLR